MTAHRYVIETTGLSGQVVSSTTGTTDDSKSDLEKTLTEGQKIIAWEPIQAGATQTESGTATPPKGTAAKSGTASKKA